MTGPWVNYQRPRPVGADALLAGLESRGWSRSAAVGLLSNAERESSLDPHAIGDNGNAYGLFQWNGPRKVAYLEFAKSRGKPSFDAETQLDFLEHEVSRDYPGLKDEMNGLPAGPAAALFTYRFERPAQTEKKAQERAGLATRLWKTFGPIGTAQAEDLPAPPSDRQLGTDEGPWTRYRTTGPAPTEVAPAEDGPWSRYRSTAPVEAAPEGGPWTRYQQQGASAGPSPVPAESLGPVPVEPPQQLGAGAMRDAPPQAPARPMPNIPAPPVPSTATPGVGSQIMGSIRGGMS